MSHSGLIRRIGMHRQHVVAGHKTHDVDVRRDRVGLHARKRLAAAAQAHIDGFVQFAQSAMYAPLAILEFLLVCFGLFMSTMHLGKPATSRIWVRRLRA